MNHDEHNNGDMNNPEETFQDEVQETVQDENQDTAATGGKTGSRKILGLALKIVIVIAIFAVAFYFIYFRTVKEKAFFVLSKSEINSKQTAKSTAAYNSGDKVYFYVSGKGKTVNATTVTLKISFIKNKVSGNYKQITYEIRKDFTHISSYIPSEYLKKPGSYKIESFIDGNRVGNQLIHINMVKPKKE